MRTTHLASLLLYLAAFSSQGLAQGEINYSLRVTGSIVAHVYEPIYRDFLYGNTAAETPVGTQTYPGNVIQGTGYSAQLFAANGADQDESALTAVPGSIVSFGTGTTLGGTITPLTLAIPQVPVGGTGTFQLRVWDNLGGTLTGWDEAFSSWADGQIAAGKSQLFNISSLTANPNIPPNMLGFQSFALTSGIPEPGTWVLFAGGSLALIFFRRINSNP